MYTERKTKARFQLCHEGDNTGHRTLDTFHTF